MSLEGRNELSTPWHSESKAGLGGRKAIEEEGKCRKMGVSDGLGPAVSSSRHRGCARPRSPPAMVGATAVQHRAASQRRPVLPFSIQFIARHL